MESFIPFAVTIWLWLAGAFVLCVTGTVDEEDSIMALLWPVGVTTWLFAVLILGPPAYVIVTFLVWRDKRRRRRAHAARAQTHADKPTD